MAVGNASSPGASPRAVECRRHASRLASRRDISGELSMRIDAAVRAGHLPAQDTALAATALLGAPARGPGRPAGAGQSRRSHKTARCGYKTVTLLALRAVG